MQKISLDLCPGLPGSWPILTIKYFGTRLIIRKQKLKATEKKMHSREKLSFSRGRDLHGVGNGLAVDFL